MEPMIVRYIRMSDGTKAEMCPTSEGIEIVAEDGGPLFHIGLKGGVLEVSSGMICKHKGSMYSEILYVTPRASNLIYVGRQSHDTGD